ncbi:TOBE domain-containing protein [Thiomicrospira sp. WB1]|uniref:TOBE domain-containing protein n=1 Tax=Thiomicrospira sp. WB1 TaxID=1685380 RepID=UPI000748E48D|nr:TOBE domain-containing protein [Thiomicrospira sp. WB1]KUJ71311.1 ModE family transcriptional regulator [Thiomicrospira sp. WB1]
MTEATQPEKLVQSFLLGSKQSRSGQRRLTLLSKIAHLGSLNAAAKACGMSYKGAWQAVEAMNQLADTPLVHTQKGGAGGGGMVLTPAGESLLQAYRLFEQQMQAWLETLSQQPPEMLDQLDLIRRMSMKTSARNQFFGTVTHIETGAVNCDVTLQVRDGLRVVAQITPASLERLGIAVGSDAYALIKASFVILAKDDGMQTSARNRFCGKVRSLDKGAVNTDVTLDLGGQQQVSAMITNQSCESLGVAEGEPFCALVKASHVLLAVAE